jgi:hypothetical protein
MIVLFHILLILPASIGRAGASCAPACAVAERLLHSGRFKANAAFYPQAPLPRKTIQHNQEHRNVGSRAL